MKVIIAPNLKCDPGLIRTKDIIERFNLSNVEAVCCLPFYKTHPLNEDVSVEVRNIEEEIKDADYLITLGGDGTILKVASMCLQNDVTILGVNCGNVGFLSSIDEDEIDRIYDLISGRFSVHDHMCLKVTLNNDRSYYALNEMVIKNPVISRVVTPRIVVDSKELTNNTCDGVIISTPTGSTAYSYSAGGPIIDSETEAILINPICSHTSNTNYVLSAQRKINITVDNYYSETSMVFIDSQTSFEVSHDDIITVTKSDKYLKMVRFDNKNFIDDVKNKMF